MRVILLLAATLVVAVVAQPPPKKEEAARPWPGLVRGEPQGERMPHLPPDIHEEILVRCKRPICHMFCEHGFKLDKMGCPTCHCVENSCQEKKCEVGETCTPVPGCHGDEMPCTHLKYECLADMPCAMPMCSNHCPNGYKTDKRGCMECKCKESEESEESKCGDHPCAAKHKCVVITNPFCKPGQRCGSKPMCLPLGHEENFHPYGDDILPNPGMIEELLKHGFPQPTGDVFDKLCRFRQKFADELSKQARLQLANHTGLGSILGSRAMHRPHCKENGDFHDLQCHFPDRQCWCVDDRGSMLKGSERPVKKKEDLPECTPHKTMSLDGKFLISHELENVQEHLEHIKNTIHEHMSKWLTMDKKFIIITKIEAKNTKENVIVIEFSIHHDGKTDLTALERQLLWHFQQKHASIPFLQTVLQPKVNSLKVDHHVTPMLPEHGLHMHPAPENCFMRLYHHHKIATLAGCIVGGSVFFLIVIGVIITVCKRRKMSAQFKHQKLTEKSEKYKQNLAYANELYGAKGDFKGGDDVVKVADGNNAEIQA